MDKKLISGIGVFLLGSAFNTFMAQNVTRYTTTEGAEWKQS